MFPLHDHNPTRSTPVLTVLLILANVLVFFGQLSAGLDETAFRYGVVPAALTGQLTDPGPFRSLERAAAVVDLNYDPAWLTLLSSMFMHGSIMHIVSNMWFLWVFGNNIEDALGKLRFLLFYVGCGLVAALAQVAMGPGSPIPMVGASGAIAGVLGAYLVLYPGSRVLCLITTFVITTVEVPAFIVLGMWFLLQVLNGAVQLGPHAPTGGVAYAAHAGGFLAGLLLIKLTAAGTGPARRSSRRRYSDDFPDWR